MVITYKFYWFCSHMFLSTL